MTVEIYEFGMKKGKKGIEFLAKKWTDGDIEKLLNLSPEEFDKHYDELCEEEGWRINNNIEGEETQQVIDTVTFFSNLFRDRLIETGELENDE